MFRQDGVATGEVKASSHYPKLAMPQADEVCGYEFYPAYVVFTQIRAARTSGLSASSALGCAENASASCSSERPRALTRK